MNADMMQTVRRNTKAAAAEPKRTTERVQSKVFGMPRRTFLCGCLIVSVFFGEQLEVLNIPLYCYVIVLCLLANLNSGIRIKQANKLVLFGFAWIAMASILLPFSYKSVGFVPYFSACSSAMLLVIVTLNAVDKNSLRVLLAFALGGLLLTIAVTAYELLTGQHFVPAIYESEYYARLAQGNAFGFQTNPNDNSTVLLLAGFSVFVCLEKKRLLQLILLGATLLLVWRLQSRMAVIAVFCAVAEAVLVFVFGRIMEKDSTIIKVFLIGAVLTAVGLFVSFVDFNSILDVLSDDLNYRSDSLRLEIMKRSLSSAAQNSVFFGSGAGVTQEVIGFSLHSLLVEMLCDYGMFVFVWFIVLIVKLLFAFTAPLNRKDKATVSCFATVLFIMSFCSSSMLRIRAAWVMFALFYAYFLIKQKEGISKKEPKAQRQQVKERRAYRPLRDDAQ